MVSQADFTRHLREVTQFCSLQMRHTAIPTAGPAEGLRAGCSAATLPDVLLRAGFVQQAGNANTCVCGVGGSALFCTSLVK